MKNRWLAYCLCLLMLVGCSNSLSKIQTDIEIVEGENVAENADDYEHLLVRCCDHKLTIYEDDNLMIEVLEGYHADYAYNLKLEFSNKLDVEQILTQHKLEINDIDVEFSYQKPLRLKAKGSEIVEYSFDLKQIKALGMQELKAVNLQYTLRCFRNDRFYEVGDIEAYFKPIEQEVDSAAYIAKLHQPMFENEDITMWYLDDSRMGKDKEVYLLVKNKKDENLSVTWEDISINGAKVAEYYHMNLPANDYHLAMVAYGEKEGYQVTKVDKIEATMKVYVPTYMDIIWLYDTEFQAYTK